MNRLVTCIWSLCLVASAMAQYWVRGIGGPSNDAFTDLVIDASGNTYVTGEFGGVIEIGASTMTTYGSLDVVVAKFDPQGELVWATHFGGPGLDRGTGLALGPSAQLVVVGQYMSTASFGATSLTASGMTQDAFTASMDAITGEVEWVRSSGGPDWVDQPTGVSVAADGAIAIAGEFRGTAQFGAQSFTSVIDPETGEPSVDIYLQTYTSDGTPGWSKHGAAEWADRGMDVAHLPTGDIILTGQFSDTLVLGGVVHNNAMYSAVFLARYSAAGTEQWFRVCGGGSYNQVFDILVTPAGRIFLTGDMQGTVIFLDQVPDLFTAAAPRSSFLLEISAAGELLQRTTWGSQHDQSTRSLSVFDDEVAVLGRFACQYTGFSNIYGDGTFLATSAYDLYIARFELEGFEYKDAQQFGGTGPKAIGALVHDPSGLLIFSGSFANKLILPVQDFDEIDVDPETFLYGGDYGSIGYCQDPFYVNYAALDARELKDAFITRGFVPGRVPYDFFLREGTGCEREVLPMHIIYNSVYTYSTEGIYGPDSTVACDSVAIWLRTRTTYSSDEQPHTSPGFEFLWNNGDTAHFIWATETGWYSVQASSKAGCLSGSDSIYVTVNSSPEMPLISDDQGVNNSARITDPVVVCAPIEPWLWATNIASGDTVSWIFDASVDNDSIQAQSSGSYQVVVTNQYSCQSSNDVEVIINPNEPLGDLDLDFTISYPQDPDGNDSIVLCPNDLVTIAADWVLTLDGDTIDLPYGLTILIECGNGWASGSGSGTALCDVYAPGTGWLTTEVRLAMTNAPCGTDTIFVQYTGSIHVRPVTLEPPLVSVTGPTIICPSDTAQLTSTCTNCTSFSWSNNTLGVDGSSAYVNGAGTYVVSAVRADTNGCTVTAYDYHIVYQYPRPNLGSFPTDAIICPDSTAVIFSDSPGLSYQWYGPAGPINTQNDSISTSQPGEYYLELVDLEGCSVNSDPILITDYATPYLNVLPDGILCETGETAELQVVTTSESTLQWSSPLSGGALSQTVDQPGTYTCSVQACGITTPLTTVVLGSTAEAFILAGGSIVACEGTSVELEAALGQAFYFWEPGEFIGPVYTVDQPGTYTLVASDHNGCSDTTAVVVVFVPVPVTLEANTSDICTGDTLSFLASGSGTLIWSSDAQGLNVVGNGPVLVHGVATIPGVVTYFVRQDMGVCSTEPLEVSATVYPYPSAPVVSGPDSACVGEPFTLTSQGQAGVTFNWTTPVGPHTGEVLGSSSAVLGDAGVYSILASTPACSVQGAPHALTILESTPLWLGNDTIFCEGAGVVLNMPPGFNDPIWNTTETTPSIYVSGGGTYSIIATDINGCAATDEIEVIKIVCEITPPNVMTPNGDGVNDTWAPLGRTGSQLQLQVFNRYGNLVWTGDPIRTKFDGVAQATNEPLVAGVYYYVLTYGGVQGGTEEERGYIHLLR